ncbi:MAG: hypothetical protein RLZ83_282, partial [Pseudomonadota bacterium]
MRRSVLAAGFAVLVPLSAGAQVPAIFAE